jgi:MOSC domain-containing protein YiiM
MPGERPQPMSGTVTASTERDRAEVVSVNVGRPRTVEWRGRHVTSAIWKEPVDGPVTVEGVNLAGDDQADRRVHGGPDKAVYAYAVEDYHWWAANTGVLDAGVLAAGTFGENLTTRGIDLNDSHIGDRWHVGSAILEVSQPREPCFKLGIRMGDDHFPGKFAAARRPGVYLRIISAGVVTSGDPIQIDLAEQPAIRISSLVEDDVPREVLRHAAGDPRVPAGWRRSAARALGRSEP